MNRGGGVHTVPAGTGNRWWNCVNGKVLSRHQLEEVAVEAGREIARKLRVEHTIERDVVIGERGSYGSDSSGPSSDGGDAAAGPMSDVPRAA